jgi:hypothetical protein
LFGEQQRGFPAEKKSGAMSNRRVRLVYMTQKLMEAKMLTKKPVWFEPLVK